MKYRHVYYIKLGRGGVWEENSIAHSRIRFGWRGQSIVDVNSGHWDRIRLQLQQEHVGKPQVATNDLNRLKDISGSTPDDIWITFHKSKLWWSRVAEGLVREDQTSKFRDLAQPWSDKSAPGRLLVAAELPGTIAQLQAFRGTVCRVSNADTLARVLAGTKSPVATEMAATRTELARAMAEAIKLLHWKDFETLVDLVFRAAGWVRISVLGQQAKGYDLELREPVTGDRYVVQVKSEATRQELDDTLAQFSPRDYRRVFFVVHTHEEKLLTRQKLPRHVDIVGPQRLAELALGAGLVQWLEDKAA